MATTAVARADEGLRQTKRCLLLGIALWFLTLNVVYALASVGCYRGWFPFSLAGFSGLQIMETVVTLASLAVMLRLILLPWRAWRSFQSKKPLSNPHLLEDTENDRVALVAFVATLLNSAFLLFVIASFVPILALSACRFS